jgi:DNA helicase-2/ATP-dependent DNA helicase PcrA
MDRAAWAHILESPLIGVGPSIVALRPVDRASDQPRPWTQWITDPQTLPADLPERDVVRARLDAFRSFFEVAHARWNLLQPGAYLDWLWRASGIEFMTLSSGDEQTSLVLKQLLRDADDYAAAHPLEGIAGFATVLQQRVATQPRVALPTAPATDAVEIATVHQAKGREWPVVFAYHTALPGARSGQVERVLWDEQWKLVISDGSSKAENDSSLQQLRDDFRRRQRNEERSIWYVALTRAQQRLYLMHSGCELEGDNFADVRAKQNRRDEGASPTKQDEAVHFFHELWHQIRTTDHVFGKAITCVAYPPLGTP